MSTPPPPQPPPAPPAISLYDYVHFVMIPPDQQADYRDKKPPEGLRDIPWPCLKFGSRDELLLALKRRAVIGSPGSEKVVKGNLAFHGFAMRQKGKFPVAYLLGKVPPVLLGRKSPKKVKAMYVLPGVNRIEQFVDTLEVYQETYGDDKRWRAACDEGLQYLNDFDNFETSDSEDEDSDGAEGEEGGCSDDDKAREQGKNAPPTAVAAASAAAEKSTAAGSAATKEGAAAGDAAAAAADHQPEVPPAEGRSATAAPPPAADNLGDGDASGKLPPAAAAASKEAPAGASETERPIGSSSSSSGAAAALGTSSTTRNRTEEEEAAQDSDAAPPASREQQIIASRNKESTNTTVKESAKTGTPVSREEEQVADDSTSKKAAPPNTAAATASKPAAETESSSGSTSSVAEGTEAQRKPREAPSAQPATNDVDKSGIPAQNSAATGEPGSGTRSDAPAERSSEPLSDGKTSRSPPEEDPITDKDGPSSVKPRNEATEAPTKKGKKRRDPKQKAKGGTEVPATSKTAKSGKITETGSTKTTVISVSPVSSELDRENLASATEGAASSSARNINNASAAGSPPQPPFADDSGDESYFTAQKSVDGSTSISHFSTPATTAANETAASPTGRTEDGTRSVEHPTLAAYSEPADPEKSASKRASRSTKKKSNNRRQSASKRAHRTTKSALEMAASTPSPGRNLAPKQTASKRKTAPSASKSSQKKARVESKKIRKIPTFREVKPFLFKMGYTSKSGIYYLPVDPGVAEETVECSLYSFDDEESLKAFLCEHGVKGNVDALTEDQKTPLEDWVAYAIVSDPGAEARELSPNEATALLQKLCFKYRGGLYWLPGVTAKTKQEGVNAFPWESLLAYLCRKGLPQNCKFDKITKEDRVSLEFYLTDERRSDIPNVDTFEYKPPGSLVGCTSRLRKRSSPRSCSPGESTVTSEDSRDSAKSTRTLAKKKARLSKPHSSLTEDGSRLASDRDHDDSQSVFSRGPVFDPTNSPPSIRPESKVSLSPIGKGDNTPLPDTKLTNREKLESCLQELKASAPDGLRNLDMPDDSEIAKNMKDVVGFLHSAAESKGRHDSDDGDASVSSLYVSGGPGVGKTSAVLWCCEKVVAEYAEKNDGPNSLAPKKLHINVNHIHGRGDGNSVRHEIAKALGLKDTRKDSVRKHLTRNHQVLFLVLDEVDSLLQGSATALTGAEKELRTLLAWADDSNFPMVLIGISNTRLQSVGMFKKSLLFQPYSKEDLVHILRSRVGVSTVPEPVFQLVATKVASTSGDARKAFDLLSEAIQNCMGSMQAQSKLDEMSTGPLVQMAHVQAATKEKTREIPQLVASLPQNIKYILCCLTAVAQGNVKRTTIGNLKRFIVGCARSLGVGSGVENTVEFVGALVRLQDAGLLSTDGTDLLTQQASFADLASQKIVLGLQREDVEKAVEDELCKNSSFFHKLRQCATQQKDTLEAE